MLPNNPKPYDPLSWRAIAGGILVACCAWLATRALWHAERAIIADGQFGYVPDPAGTKEFLAQLEKPTFRQAAAEVIAGAKQRDTYLYRAADKAHRAVYGKPFGPWNQGAHGSCVSFGWAMGAYVGQAIEWQTGEQERPPLLVATEPIYGGSRTAARLPPVRLAGYSDGSYGAAAARWASGLKNGRGGILYREKYGNVDLSTYSIPLSREWGNSGVPDALAVLANDHTARAVALIETWEGLCASLESGYPVPICSNVGFAATNFRDADGFLPRGGTWNHCMVAISVKYAKNSGVDGAPPMKNPRDGVLILNSWGANWCGGGKHPADQPDGSFWITRQDAEAIVRQGDSFSIGGATGFQYRDLHNGNWMMAL